MHFKIIPFDSSHLFGQYSLPFLSIKKIAEDALSLGEVCMWWGCGGRGCTHSIFEFSKGFYV